MKILRSQQGLQVGMLGLGYGGLNELKSQTVHIDEKIRRSQRAVRSCLMWGCNEVSCPVRTT